MDDADELRGRLRDARGGAPPVLDDDAYGRIVQHVVRHGPDQVRRSRRRRSLLRAGALVLPLALLGGWLGLRADGGERAAPLAAGAAKQPLCAGLAALSTGAAPRADGSQLVDLGAVGQIVLEPGSEARLDAADPCRMQLQLTAGRASVHAANLFGGELTVRAGDTAVVVHGTTFAVERAADEILVDVESGEVSVERAGRAVAGLVRSGQRLRLTRTSAAVVLPLAEGSRAQLRARFEVAVQPRAGVGEQLPASEPTHPRASAARLGERAGAAAARNAARHGSVRVAELEAAERARDASQPSARVAKLAAAERAASQPPTPARPRSDAAALVARADGYWKAGALDEARASYRAAGALSGPTAEAAWLALARKELADGRTDAAREALASHASRFPRGKLAGEAAGIELRTALQAEDYAAAERVARHLVERYAGTPQAEAASRWLRARGSSPP
jgi:hypothetical protein